MIQKTTKPKKGKGLKERKHKGLDFSKKIGFVALSYLGLLFGIVNPLYTIFERAALQDRMEVCKYSNRDEFVFMATKPGLKISFLVNNANGASISLLNDGGSKRYKLTAIGSSCVTFPEKDKTNLFGVVIRYVAAEGDGERTCRVSQVIIPTNMVSCSSGVNYKPLTDVLKFKESSTVQEHTSIAKKSKLDYNSNHIRGSYGVVLWVRAGTADAGNFNDDFLQALIAAPNRESGAKRLVHFWSGREDFKRYRDALARKSHTLKVSDYLKRIGWMGKPGYMFLAEGSPLEDRFSYSFSSAKSRLSWSLMLQFYIGALQGFGPSNNFMLKIRTDNKDAPPTMEVHKYAYNVEVKTGTGNELELKLLRLDAAENVLETMTTTIPVTKNDEYVHFGVMLGITPLYDLTGTANFKFRIYEQIYCWHDGKTKDAGGFYDIQGSEKLSTYEGDDNAQFVDLTAVFYSDLSKTARRTNFCGLRFFMFDDTQGAYPSHKIDGLANNDNPQGLCMARGVNHNHCNAYAFQTKPGVASTHYIIDSEFTPRSASVPVEICEVLYRDKDCMVPVVDYNRELLINDNPHIDFLPKKLTDFEGSGEAAQKLKSGRVRFPTNDPSSTYYWIRCPFDCKFSLI